MAVDISIAPLPHSGTGVFLSTQPVVRVVGDHVEGLTVGTAVVGIEVLGEIVGPVGAAVGAAVEGTAVGDARREGEL